MTSRLVSAPSRLEQCYTKIFIFSNCTMPLFFYHVLQSIKYHLALEFGIIKVLNGIDVTQWQLRIEEISLEFQKFRIKIQHAIVDGQWINDKHKWQEY